MVLGMNCMSSRECQCKYTSLKAQVRVKSKANWLDRQLGGCCFRENLRSSLYKLSDTQWACRSVDMGP